MHTGLGEENWYRKKYEKHRREALEDRYDFTDEELEKYEVEFPLGAGRTDETFYKVKQFPFPTDLSVRSRKTIDIRKVPRLGV